MSEEEAPQLKKKDKDRLFLEDMNDEQNQSLNKDGENGTPPKNK